ncbi:MAG: hypothetical protein K9N48_01570, partial [Verrucomicrobia bacterium]|nr:hypothetical protein [Verrucomicrobiota bacterium]
AISDRLQQLGGVHAEFSSIDWIITSSEAKHKLHYASGADAVDMESAVIRRICKDNNIPSANIRAILDTANENLPLDFNKHKTDEFNLNYRGIALDILNNPSSIKNLIAFGIRAESVARKLSKYLERLLISFC